MYERQTGVKKDPEPNSGQSAGRDAVTVCPEPLVVQVFALFVG
jgi:predicted RNase H-like nuclease